MKKTGAELQKVEQQNYKIQMPKRNEKSITGKWKQKESTGYVERKKKIRYILESCEISAKL